MSRRVYASRSYHCESAGGFGIHPRKAPFGHTGTRLPLIVNPALPFPTDPKTKFESRDPMTAFRGGYTTLIARGPSTSGTGGSLGLGAGSGALASVGAAGGAWRAGGAETGLGAADGGVLAHASPKAAAASAAPG